MRLEAARLRERTAAFAALVRLHAGMYSHVFRQITGIVERLVTDATLERLLTGVD